MNPIYQSVPIKGMTAEEVLILWLQGELYVAVVKKEETQEEQVSRCQQEALSYVQCLEPYVSSDWKPFITNLWQAIIRDELITPSLVHSKGRHQGHLNKYYLTNIVFHLKALDIYQCDSLLELHKTLEGVEQKNSIYKSAAIYGLCSRQRFRIREISQKVAGLK